MAYLYLGIAIVAEVAGTAALKGSMGFSVVLIVAYAIAFFFLALTLRTIPVGIAYAVWGGVGMALIVIAGAVLFSEVPDLPAIIGVGLILMGVVILNTMSATTAYSGMSACMGRTSASACWQHAHAPSLVAEWRAAGVRHQSQIKTRMSLLLSKIEAPST